ncbi:hypothetical protein HDU82_005041 [Entophlyctis luteolus]|nr:hypothetical protein HDU82_005041 [Entophlyctis luteolus]
MADKNIDQVEDGDQQQQPQGKKVCGIVWNKKRLIILVVCLAIGIVVIALLAVFVIAPKIAQSALDGSQLNLSSSTIAKVTEESFAITSSGNATNTGAISADISFPDPVSVYWVNDGPDMLLGTLTLQPISASGGYGDVSLNSTFVIANTTAVGLFSVYMIQGTSWSWRLSGSCTVKALGITMNGISLNKIVTMSGFAGLNQTTVKGLDAGNAPNNEVSVNVTTAIINPSTITIDMGTCVFDFTMGNGQGNMTANNVIMVPGSNILTLSGVIFAPANTSGLDVNEKLAAVVAPGGVVPVTVLGDHVISNGAKVSWLNAAFKTLDLGVKMNLTDIAQSAVTGSVLSLSSNSISSIAENSFYLSGAGEATQAGYMDAELTFPNPVSVYWSTSTSDILLGTLRLSPLIVNGTYPKSGAISIGSNFNISDTNAMANFSSALINDASFTWRLVGTANAEAYGMVFENLLLDKKVTVGGFDALTNVTVVAFDLPTSDSTNGIHIATTADLVNPSSITIAMGDVSFGLEVNGTSIGSLAATALTMTPGVNSVPMTGYMKLDNEDMLSAMFESVLGGSGLATVVIGKSSSLGASWLDASLTTLKLNVFVPSPTLTSPIISGLSIPAMGVEMIASDQTGMTTLLSSAKVGATFNLPYDFSVSVQSVAQSLTFYDVKSGTAFATLETDTTAATSDMSTHTITTSISNAAFNAISGQEALFESFFYTLGVSSSASVAIKGTATSVASTDAGTVKLALPLSDTLTIAGFDGLKNLVVKETLIVGGDSTGVKLQVSVVLNNPSTLTLTTHADATFDLMIGSTKVGTAVIPQVALVPGDNAITTSGTISGDSSNAAVVTALMAGFIAGESAQVTIQGTSSTISYTSLQSTFAAMSIPATISGPSPAPVLVSSSVMYLNTTVLTEALAFQVFGSGNLADLTVTVNNPFDTDYTIYTITSTVTMPQFNNKVAGTINVNFGSAGLLVPKGGSVVSPKFPLIQTVDQEKGTLANQTAILEYAAAKTFVVDAAQQLGIAIGTAQASLPYTASNISVSVQTE